MRGDVLFDAASRGRYATDAFIYQITPLGVAVPSDQDDLRVALAVARSERVAVLARGAGTSQCGQTVGDALVVDTSKWLKAYLSNRLTKTSRTDRSPPQKLGLIRLCAGTMFVLALLIVCLVEFARG